MDPSELDEARAPEAMKRALAVKSDELAHAAHQHGGGELASVRTVSYRGHEIVIRTSYTITVDGQPFDVHVTVDNAGRVHYHGLPTRDFASVVDLVQKAIDVFPGDFNDHPPGGPGHEPGAHGHSAHGNGA
jgi:hypothetical protein